MQTAASAVRYLPDVEGTVRLVEGVAGSIDKHLAGAAFPVRIRSLTTRGVNEKTFGLRFHFLKGRLDRITLTHELSGGEEHEASEYAIDCSFGPELGHWECGCRDFASRGRKREVPHCRHTKSAHKVAVLLGAI